MNLNTKSGLGFEVFKTAHKVDFKPANGYRRLAAAGLDLIFMLLPERLLQYGLEPFLHSQMASVISFLACFLFFWVYLNYRFGATPGKRLMGLRIVGRNGHLRMGFLQVLLRETLGRALCVASLGLGFLWVWITPQRRGWHDLLTQTRVVDYR